MKKTALAFSMACILSAATLTGCSSKVNPLQVDGKDVVFTMGEKNYTVEDLFGLGSEEFTYNLLNTESTKTLAFKAIQKAVIQQSVKKGSNIIAEAELEEKKWRDNIKEQASEFGISTKEQTEKAMKEIGAETNEDVKEYFIYQAQQKQIKTLYIDANLEAKATDDVATQKSKLLGQYVDTTLPYHVKHVLVKVSDQKNYYKKVVSIQENKEYTLEQGATLTELEANKLGSVIMQLALGKANGNVNSFANIARSKSEDEGSALKNGDLGIMDINTSYVDEFKYGLYSYELAMGNISAENKTKFNISNEVNTSLFGASGIYADTAEKANGISTVKVGELYKQFVTNGESKGNQDWEAIKNDPTKEKPLLYPRNIAYNSLLNTPKVQFLEVESGIDTTLFPESAQSTITIDGKKIVADCSDASNPKPIILARSSYGMHFIAVEMAPYAKDIYTYYGKTGPYVTNMKKLDDTNAAQAIQDQVVNFLKGASADSTLSPNDMLYEYAIYEAYKTDDIKFVNKKIEAIINQQIEAVKAERKFLNENYKLASWERYLRLLQRDIEARA